MGQAILAVAALLLLVSGGGTTAWAGAAADGAGTAAAAAAPSAPDTAGTRDPDARDAAADTSGVSTDGDAATALPDSAGAGTAAEQPPGLFAARLAARQEQAQVSPGGGALILSWARTPEAGLRAQVRKVEYYGSFDNDLVLARQARLSQTFNYSTEEFRKQDKTVDRSDASLVYRGGETLPVASQLRFAWQWSEDRTVNSAGNLNLIKRDFRQAALNLSKEDLETGPVTHGVYVDGGVDDNRGENQQQRSDYTEGRLAGALRSRFEPLTGVAVTTSLYEQRSDGERALGEVSSPSSAGQDTLAGGVHYRRGIWRGSFSAAKASFDRRYLDWRRNTNGALDTLEANIPAGESKIVEELETKDALSLEWDNKLRLGRVGLASRMTRDTEDQDYRFSGIGRKERFNDRWDADISFRYTGEDSVKLSYNYEYKWDDQTYQGKSNPRGKQIQKRRNAELTMIQRLFPHSVMTLKYGLTLTQDTAENGFNDNDRDRFETGASAKLVSDWTGRFQASMLFSFRHVEDISLLSSRSANNNDKDTYEIVPGYTWPVASWLDLKQDFRISIQFTDYVFSDLESVSRQDDYNKRGNLNTRVTLRPSERLSLTVSHDYSAKFNATRTRTDATGVDFYSRDQEQRISTIDLELEYRATDWLKLEGASYRTKDLKDIFGATVRSTDTRSGEVWVGCVVSKKWGKGQDRVLAATVKRFEAYGPNVQESNARYWDADASFTWKF